MVPASVLFLFLVLITKVVAWAAVMADEGVAAKTGGWGSVSAQLCHRQRDVISKLCKKISFLFLPNSLIHAWLNQQTRDSSYSTFLFVHLWSCLLSSFVWDCLLLLNLRTIFHFWTDSSCSTFRTPWISCPFQPKQAFTRSKVMWKHKETPWQIKLLFSMLFCASYQFQIAQRWKHILLTINVTCLVGQVLYEFQLSKSKTFWWETSGWVKVLCPALRQQHSNYKLCENRLIASAVLLFLKYSRILITVGKDLAAINL